MQEKKGALASKASLGCPISTVKLFFTLTPLQ